MSAISAAASRGRPRSCLAARHRRHHAACSASLAVQRTAQPCQRKYLAPPTVLYSTCKEDITLADLRRLYRTVHARHPLAGSSVGKSFFSHWQQLSDAEADAKLQLLLDRSVAVVAAFTRDPHVYADEQPQQQQPPSPLAWPQAGGGMPGGLPGWGLGWRHPRQLVGFVRAAGDESLVATIHDLLIHPDLRRFGVGAVLMRRLVGQVTAGGVSDVGLVTPSALQPFFRRCAFELDSEGSVPMALTDAPRWRQRGVDDINRHCSRRGALQALLQQRAAAAAAAVAAAGQQQQQDE